ncbi:hypothetical protein VNO80_09130 [Phaseolus coccineus]|uniref:Uncharacterized protein n=1 Tax=Phaseolus coccineus TaxID=3886 RepID=A0AAN9N7E7_PHACN
MALKWGIRRAPLHPTFQNSCRREPLSFSLSSLLNTLHSLSNFTGLLLLLPLLIPSLSVRPHCCLLAYSQHRHSQTTMLSEDSSE